MAYWSIQPEVAGEIGEGSDVDYNVHPPIVRSLEYELSDWLGDHILESFPVYVVSEQLGEALTRSGLRAFELRDCRITLSEDAQEILEGVELPKFKWLVVTGTAGREDLGVNDNARLVVSDQALEVIQSFPTQNAEIDQFS